MFLLSLISFAVLIVILVTVHEFGHLIAARANGVMVEAFSVGMGPVLWKKKDKFGTEWRISLLPIGGYVKMLGDADATSVREQKPDNISEEDMEMFSIHRKKPYQRLIVAAAGPFMNLIFAIIVITTLAIVKGIPVPSNIVNVIPNTPAQHAGLQDRDKIISVNERKVNNLDDIKKCIRDSIGNVLHVRVIRDKKEREFAINMVDENKQKQTVIGISSATIDYKSTGVIDAFFDACKITYTIAIENMKGLAKIITGKQSYKNAGGIISIAKIAEQGAKAGIAKFVWVIAFLSIVLGAVNLLPIPMLDGGTILLSLIEMVAGRPINKKVIDTLFYIGFAIVAALMVLGLWNDCTKIPLIQKLFSLK